MTIRFNIVKVSGRDRSYYEPDYKMYKNTIYSYTVDTVSVDDRTINGTEYDLKCRQARIINSIINKFKSIKLIRIDRPDLGDDKISVYFYFINKSDEAYFLLWSNDGVEV
jgi:hypothetical protein